MDPCNPRLLVDKRPLAKFWILDCELMGWLWVDPMMSSLSQDLKDLRVLRKNKPNKKEMKKQLCFDLSHLSATAVVKKVKAKKTKGWAQRQFLSEAEQAREITQIWMDGIPRSNAEFFWLSVAWNWEGDKVEEGMVKDRGAKAIVSRLRAAMEQAPDNLMVLPVSNCQFKEKKLWLKSVEDLGSLTSLIHQAGHTIPRSGKNAGLKILRTRIRLAFKSPKDLIKPMLYSLFAKTGYNMGLYRSPLQVGNPVHIGWLLKYPEWMSKEAMEREFMRKFKFQIPIPLELSFPSNPASKGKTFIWGGWQAWHVIVPAHLAQQVHHKLSEWLRQLNSTGLSSSDGGSSKGSMSLSSYRLYIGVSPSLFNWPGKYAYCWYPPNPPLLPL